MSKHSQAAASKAVSKQLASVAKFVSVSDLHKVCALCLEPAKKGCEINGNSYCAEHGTVLYDDDGRRLGNQASRITHSNFRFSPQGWMAANPLYSRSKRGVEGFWFPIRMAFFRNVKVEIKYEMTWEFDDFPSDNFTSPARFMAIIAPIWKYPLIDFFEKHALKLVRIADRKWNDQKEDWDTPSWFWGGLDSLSGSLWQWSSMDWTYAACWFTPKISQIKENRQKLRAAFESRAA